MKAKEDVDIPGNFTGIFEACDGTQFIEYIHVLHVKNGKYHRENGPTVEYMDGKKFWYFMGARFLSEKEWKFNMEKFQKESKHLK
jgi:hypothetical protein